MSKGFIIKQDENFLALPPRQALNGRARQFEAQFSDEQKRRREAEERLTTILENSSAQGEETGPSEISVLKGFNTIANKFAELLEDSRDVILVAKRAVEAREFFIPILLEFANKESRQQANQDSCPKKRQDYKRRPAGSEKGKGGDPKI